MDFNKLFSYYLLGLSFSIIVSLCESLSTCDKNGAVIQEEEEENSAVSNLKTYLRILTAHPNPEPGYREAMQWLESQAEEIGLKFSVLRFSQKLGGNSVVIITWRGRDPSLKSIMFNSHMDVVAAEPSKWKCPPFEACKDEEGNIFARGATDMKAYTVAILEAIRRLKHAGFQPLRTINVTVLPDEEKGGLKGMKPFVESNHFRSLNVGISIDECGGNWWNDTMRICYAEKASWQFNITTKGEPGHGAWFPEHTAGNRLQIVLDRFFKFRHEQYEKIESAGWFLEQVTTVNLVGLGGGTANNIIASELWAAFDMRIRQHSNWKFTDVDKFIASVMEEARLGSNSQDDVSINFLLKTLETGETAVDDSNVWWTVVQDTCEELDIYCRHSVLNGFTDGRYIRNLGIPVFGLSPFLSTPGTAHKHNEFINEFEFLEGIVRYEAFIRHLSTTPRYSDDS